MVIKIEIVIHVEFISFAFNILVNTLHDYQNRNNCVHIDFISKN